MVLDQRDGAGAGADMDVEAYVLASCSILSRSWWTSSSSAKILWCSSASTSSRPSVVAKSLRGSAQAPMTIKAAKKRATLTLFISETAGQQKTLASVGGFKARGRLAGAIMALVY